MINVLQGRLEVNLMIDISYHKNEFQMLNSDDSHTMKQEYRLGFRPLVLRASKRRTDLKDHLGPPFH